MSLQPQQHWQKGKKETPEKVRWVRTIAGLSRSRGAMSRCPESVARGWQAKAGLQPVLCGPKN